MSLIDLDFWWFSLLKCLKSLPYRFSNSSLSFTSFFTTSFDFKLLAIALQLSFLFFTSSNILIFSSNDRHRLLNLPASLFFWVDGRHVDINFFVCPCKQCCNRWMWNRTKTLEFRKFEFRKIKTKFVLSFGMTFITLLFWAIRKTVFNADNVKSSNISEDMYEIEIPIITEKDSATYEYDSC